jgi:hypothetical protein
MASASSTLRRWCRVRSTASVCPAETLVKSVCLSGQRVTKASVCPAEMLVPGEARKPCREMRGVHRREVWVCVRSGGRLSIRSSVHCLSIFQTACLAPCRLSIRRLDVGSHRRHQAVTRPSPGQSAPNLLSIRVVHLSIRCTFRPCAHAAPHSADRDRLVLERAPMPSLSIQAGSRARGL